MTGGSRAAAALVALSLAGGAPALAQRTSDDPDYVVTNWQTEDGLPENSATAIAQTADGYLWFGTFKGLVRFDGVKFTVFDATNTPGLPGPAIINLHLDRAGRLWVSTTRGLASLREGQWRAYGPADGWSGDYVRWFAETEEGQLFFATFDGRVLRRLNERLEALPDPRPGNRDAFFPWVDETGRLCVLQSGFAAAWTGEGWQPLDLPVPPALGPDSGWAQVQDGSLVNAGGRALARLRGGRVVERRALAAELQGFWSIVEDSRGFIWFSSYDHGLHRIAPDGTTRHFSLAGGFPSDWIRVVFEDRQGNLWVGTNSGGLVRLRPRRFTSFAQKQGLPPLSPTSVAIGPDGAAYVAMYGYGLHEIRAERATPARVPEAFAYPQTVMVDHVGRLWAGTYRSGLYVREGGRWTTVLPRPRTVSALFEDSQGRTWASTPSEMLVWDDPANPPRVLPASVPEPDISCFGEDAATGTLWAGGQGGLFRLDGGRFVQVPGPAAVAGFEAVSLHVDAAARVWVGTPNGSLWLRSPEGWTDVGARTGLPTLAITGLREESGSLWAATNLGVFRTDMAKLAAAATGGSAGVVWQSFGAGDGLPSVECSSTATPSIARDAEGRLWFCTLRGVAVVDPRRLEASSDDMPVHLERFGWVDGAARPGEAALRSGAEVQVPAGSHDFGLSFTALDLAAPEKVLFSSRLEKDGEAVATTVSLQREIRIPAVEPGHYRFTLRARNGDGVWSRHAVDARFRVLPFFWQTAWFQLAGLLAAAAAAALVTRGLTLARARRAQELSALQARLALVLANTNDAVTFTAPDETLTYMNEAAARLLGLPDTRVEGLRAEDLHPPWALDLVRSEGMEAVRRDGSWQGQSALRSRDGREIPVWQLLVGHRNETGALDFVSSIARDMTELRRMEEQVRQAQKMESVGLLAGGVAHDFNNLLQVVQAHAALARRPAIAPEARDAHLRSVLDAADRAAGLTRQLLALGRRQPLRLEDTDLADLVGRHLSMVQRVIGENVSIELRTAGDVDRVRCDRAQLEQVVLNLCVNARDAMPQGGRLTLSLENLSMSAAFVAANPWARAGRYVVLSVADTGCGMDAATRERIFEPFFTTKAAGTGLGLAVVYGIVRQHSGLLRVYSEPGEGTVFKIYLPSAGHAAAPEPEAPREPPPGGTEGILLAEDDAGVAGVTRRVLESAGYTVDVAPDGAAAVRLFREQPERFDLLLFDLVMPVLSGREAREEIRRLRPSVPALYCSGYAAPDSGPFARDLAADDPLIAKPYDPDDLLRKVREILDGAARRRP